MREVPFVETPLIITVIRLTQLGNEVKSIEVPLVEATAVDKTLAELVAVAASKVSVFVPATAGAAIVTAPLVSPEIITDDIYFLKEQPSVSRLGW